MKTLFAFILVLSFGSVFAEDHVSTEGTICADRASGKSANLDADNQGSEEVVSADDASAIEN
tara:strand:- start:18819 stop:19004 length:186 start_codon:yes stop_codon:yes gene_type:complete